MWYKDGRRVVTNSLEHWQSLIQSHHDPLVYRHLGINQTICLLEWYYWWPGLQKEVTEYVWECAKCQWHKVNNWPTWAALSPIYPTLKALPFKTIALDFITKLPESQGFDFILTITDHDCTKMLWFIPCREEINTGETAALYAKHILYSPLMDSPPKSLVTETLVSPHNPQESCAKSWASNRTSLWCITPTLTDNQSGQISGWNNISVSGQMSIKITGLLTFPWQNSLTTIGQMRPCASPLSSFWWDTTHVLIGQTAHHRYHKWCCTWTNSNRHESAQKNSWLRHKSHGSK